MDKSTNDISTDPEDLSDHVYIYFQQIDNPEFVYTTPEFKEQTYNLLDHFIDLINYAEGREGKEDNGKTKEYRQRLKESKEKVDNEVKKGGTD